MSYRRDRYPLGAHITEAELIADPYPVYAALLAQEPVSWIECLKMWWVVGYRDVSTILMDQETYLTHSGRSPIYDTFGKQMLSVEGDDHRRYKNAARPPLAPETLRKRLQSTIVSYADALIDQFFQLGHVELRSAFASQLPVRVMLSAFGMPQSDGQFLRSCYDSFEHALANFSGDEAIRSSAKYHVARLHDRLQEVLEGRPGPGTDSILGHLANLPGDAALDVDEVKRNASIILFGGISTVEALILNGVWALSTHFETCARIRSDVSAIPAVIEEVMRWQSPVQSATRCVASDTEFRGHTFKRGEVVNCILGAANRDPDVFPRAEIFDIDRPHTPRHLGFATGPHVCLGLHLARMQTRIALERLYARLPDLIADGGEKDRPVGYEFRKPAALQAKWQVAPDRAW